MTYELPHQGKVEDFLYLSMQSPDAKLYSDLVCEEFHEWMEAGFNDPEAELKEMADLVYVLYGYAIARGYDLDKAFSLVHENNLSRMRQDDGTIKRREDGKIIKNPSAPKVDLSSCINK